MVTCKAAERYRALPDASRLRYPLRVLTVISWSNGRRARKALHELVQEALSDRPTVLAVVSDLYTIDEHIRPFAPLSERFGDRIHFIVAAEWRQEDREREGEVLLQRLGLSPESRRNVLRDRGHGRVAVVLRQKRPVALLETFFEERGYTTLDGQPDPRGAEMRAREDQVARDLEELLGRLPPPVGPAPRALKSGEHDFGERGICSFCGQGRSTFLACPGTRREEGPRRDRFELIELD
jgi:hypothetical protein